MNISFNSDIAILYDFLRAIIFKYNKLDFKKRLKELGLIQSETVTDAYKYIWKDLDKETPGLALFFSKSMNEASYISYKYDSQLVELGTISNLIDDLFNGSISDLQVSLLKFYDGNENSDSYYEDIAKSSANVFSFVTSLKINDKQKIELLGIFNNPDTVLIPLKEFMHRIRKRMNHIYTNHGEYIKKFQKLMTINVRNESEHLIESISKILNIKDPLKNVQDMTITFSFFNEFAISTLFETPSVLIILGIKYDEMLQAMTKKDDSFDKERFLKAFSDKNRLKMIRLLTDTEMYVGQIAKTCGLVISTTSYHLDILLSAGILSSSVRHKRVYYTLNHSFVVEKFSEIKRAFEAKIF